MFILLENGTDKSVKKTKHIVLKFNGKTWKTQPTKQQGSFLFDLAKMSNNVFIYIYKFQRYQ